MKADRIIEVLTETGYDALQDEMLLFTRIQAGGGTIDEFASSLGIADSRKLQKRLDRLLQAGLVRRNGERYEAVGQLLYTLRQDAMVSSLTHFVLPALMQMVSRGEGMLLQMDLRFTPEEQKQVRTGLVQRMLESIDELSCEPAEKKEAYSCIVIATSDVPPPDEPASRLIETVRRAARQRTTPSEASRAILIHYHSFFGADQAGKAESLLLETSRGLDAHRATESEKGTFTLVFGFCRNLQTYGEA